MNFDLVILGSGPGGYVAAIRAAQYGLKVAVVEKEQKLGGTCLHVGCVPTKALLHYAELYEEALRSEKWGLSYQNLHLDYTQLIRRKSAIVGKHAKGVEYLFKKHKIETIRGRGTLLGKGQVEVSPAEVSPAEVSGAEVSSTGRGRTLSAPNIILATGSSALMLPGLTADRDRILTNVEILDLTEIPKSLVVIGGGAVGVEFASVFRSFGAQVTIVEMLPRLVPSEDEDVSAELARAFRKRGIEVHLGTKLGQVSRSAGGLEISLTDSGQAARKLSAGKLLVAVGRKPATGHIGLENTQVKTDRGFIEVDPWMETAEKGVYAIGDIVAGAPQLAHVASAEGLVAVGRIAGKDPEPVNYLHSPSATYCDPQIASVGLTETAAREKGHDIKTGQFPFAANSKASILGRPGGFVKVVAGARWGEILGVHIIGPSATELIAEAVTAITAEATVESMMSTIHAHPTLSEAVQEAFNNTWDLSINA